MASSSRCMKSRRFSPGSMAGRKRTVMTPGQRQKVRRGQNTPAFSANGTQGTPSLPYSAATPGL